mgnify:CR=1 FL=1
MLEEVENPKKIKSDKIVPFHYYSKNPGEIFQRHGDFYWLRQYEAELTAFLKTLKVPIELEFTPETYSPVQSALENAYVHAAGDGGKTGNMKWPIFLEIFLGDHLHQYFLNILQPFP